MSKALLNLLALELHGTRALGPGLRYAIWTQGCPGGESPESIQARVDRVIKRIKKVHSDYWAKAKESDGLDRGGDGACSLMTWYSDPDDAQSCWFRMAIRPNAR